MTRTIEADLYPVAPDDHVPEHPLTPTSQHLCSLASDTKRLARRLEGHDLYLQRIHETAPPEYLRDGCARSYREMAQELRRIASGLESVAADLEV